MNIDYNAATEILKSFLDNEKIEILGISVGEERQVRDAIKNLLTAYEKEKEKNENLLDALNNSIDIKKYWINKDKIKAKIEEVDQWELYNMKIPKLSTLDERLGAKIGIKYVLQSLLEEKEE